MTCWSRIIACLLIMHNTRHGARVKILRIPSCTVLAMRSFVPPAVKGRDRSMEVVWCRTRVQEAIFDEIETASCCLTLPPGVAESS